MERPKILDENGKLSKWVKGVIYDRDKNLVGVLLTKGEWSFIQFFGKTSLIIAFNKVTGELELLRENFIEDPKKVLRGFL